MFQGFTNQGKKLNDTRKNNKNEVLGIIEGFGGEVDRVNEEEQKILQDEEDNLLRKMSALATDHKDFVSSNDDLLKETEKCVKECQGAVPTKTMSYKEKKIHYQSCLAGCGANTSELDRNEDLHGVYKDYTNVQTQYDIDKCPDLKNYTYAPPPTKYPSEKCEQPYQCYSTKCGTSGPCKGKCYVSGRSSSSFQTVFDGRGDLKTYCNYEVSKLAKSSGYDFFFRVGNIWHKIEGYYSTYPPCKHCKDFTNDRNQAIKVMDVYGIRAYGMYLNKARGTWTVVEDQSRGVAKPSWSRIKSMLVDLGAVEDVPTKGSLGKRNKYVFVNNRYCLQPYKKFEDGDCYQDRGRRDLPTRLGDFDNIDSCKVEARKRGLNYIGIQYGNNRTKAECWGGNNPGKYGKSNNCNMKIQNGTNWGGPWANQIYRSGLNNQGSNDPPATKRWSPGDYTRHMVDGSNKEENCKKVCNELGDNCKTMAVGDGNEKGKAYNCTTYNVCELSPEGSSSSWTRGRGTTGGQYEYYLKESEDFLKQENIGFDLKGWLWKKLGPMLIWCNNNTNIDKTPFCDLCFDRGSEVDNLDISLYKKTRLYGPWIRWNIRVRRVAYLPDKRIVLISKDGKYTKMVAVRWGTRPQGRSEARYYDGPITDFDANKWNTYRYAWTWYNRWTYRVYNFPYGKVNEEKRNYGVLHKCTYENPTFPFVQFMSVVAPSYVKTDFAIGSASWYPRWWLDNKLDWAGWWTGWGGRWPYGAVWWGGKRRAEEICNDSKDCIGIFEFWKGWWAFLFPRKNNQYSSSGRRWGDPRRGEANVRQIWMKDRSNIKRPRIDGDASSRKRNNWNYWWWSTSGGRREYRRNQSNFVEGACYKDRPQRDLPHFLGYFSSIQDCKDVAKRRNLPYIGTQYGGNKDKAECWGGYNPGSYGKHRSNYCNTPLRNGTKWGGPWAQNIYKSGAPTSGYESRNQMHGWATSGRRKHNYKFMGPETGEICPANERMLAKSDEDKRKVELNKN